MYTFILRKQENGLIDSDTALLIESIEYADFMISEKEYDYLFVNSLKDIPKSLLIEKLIPVGTIEWVSDFIDYFNLSRDNFKPIYSSNIQRHLEKMSLKETIDALFTHKKLFIKETEDFKSTFSDEYGYIFDSENVHYLSKDTYFVSKVLNIDSEYRLFISDNQIKGIYNYSGDFLKFPTTENMENIKKTIFKINNEFPNLKSYTLDIALDKESIYFIEIHPFFSCGLYGFDSLQNIPRMYRKGFEYLTL